MKKKMEDLKNVQGPFQEADIDDSNIIYSRPCFEVRS